MTVRDTDVPPTTGAACTHCNQWLYGTCAFCPFCGESTASIPAKEKAIKKEAVSDDIEPQTIEKYPEKTPVPAPQSTPAAQAARDSKTKDDGNNIKNDSSAKDGSNIKGSGSGSGSGSSAKVSIYLTVAVLALAGLGWWQWSEQASTAPDACATLLGQAQTALTGSGDALAAHNLAQAAVAACQDPARNQQAQTVLQAAAALLLGQQQEQQRQTQALARCTQRYQKAVDLWNARQLKRAEQAFSAFQTDCSSSLDKNDLATKIAEALVQVEQAVQAAEQALAQGDHNLAQNRIDAIAKFDKAYPDLPRLRTQLQQLPSSLANPLATATLVQDFLKDAQIHLQRQQYDKAKAFVESAARIAPSDPEVVRMRRRIQEQELQYLRENITIE